MLILISLLIGRYSHPFEAGAGQCRREIQDACTFMEQHYPERIGLEQICSVVRLSKSALLRAFTFSKQITLLADLFQNIHYGIADLIDVNAMD